MKDSNLADKLIDRIRDEDTNDYNPTPYPDQWGIDDTGFPWPNPVNAQAVAARLFFKHGKKDGLTNIFKVDDDIFVGKRKITQNRSTLLSLYDKPTIVVWANYGENMRDTDVLWRQIKRTIGSEWPIIWKIVLEIAPEYNRDYIRITDDLIWGKDEADVLFK